MSNSFTNISELKYWCCKVLPLVYDDSLSYYEVLCKVSEKLNEVITNNNNIPEYIKELVASGGFLSGLQEQIAELNDGDSTTATADRYTGELIWLNGNLYRITRNMLAGDQYTESGTGITGNIEKITMEEWVNRYNSFIKDGITVNDEKYNSVSSSNYDANTLLWWHGKLYKATTDIDKNSTLSTDTNLTEVSIETELKNETTARKEADANLQTSITNETTAREEADKEIISKIGSSSAPYRSYAEFEIDNTGTEDCSEKLSSITDNVGLNAGTYLIANDCTITAQLAIAKGATITVVANKTLTINSTVTAGYYQIFSGEGNVKFTNGNIKADWFSTLQKAIDANIDGLSVELLAGKEYTIDKTLHITSTRITIYSTLQTRRQTAPIIKASFTSGAIIEATGTQDSVGYGGSVENLTLVNVGLSRSVTGVTGSVGLSMKWCRFAYIEHCYFTDSQKCISIEGINGVKLYDIHCLPNINFTDNTPVYGVYIDGSNYGNTGINIDHYLFYGYGSYDDTDITSKSLIYAIYDATSGSNQSGDRRISDVEASGVTDYVYYQSCDSGFNSLNYINGLMCDSVQGALVWLEGTSNSNEVTQFNISNISGIGTGQYARALVVHHFNNVLVNNASLKMNIEGGAGQQFLGMENCNHCEITGVVNGSGCNSVTSISNCTYLDLFIKSGSTGNVNIDNCTNVILRTNIVGSFNMTNGTRCYAVDSIANNTFYKQYPDS